MDIFGEKISCRKIYIVFGENLIKFRIRDFDPDFDFAKFETQNFDFVLKIAISIQHYPDHSLRLARVWYSYIYIAPQKWKFCDFRAALYSASIGYLSHGHIQFCCHMYEKKF